MKKWRKKERKKESKKGRTKGMKKEMKKERKNEQKNERTKDIPLSLEHGRLFQKAPGRSICFGFQEQLNNWPHLLSLQPKLGATNEWRTLQPWTSQKLSNHIHCGSIIKTPHVHPSSYHACVYFCVSLSYDIPLCCDLWVWVTQRQCSVWCFKVTYNLAAILPQKCCGVM